MTPWGATPVMEHRPHDQWGPRRKIYPTSPGTGRDSRKTMFTTTLTMPRHREILVEMRQGKAGSQLSHKSIRQSKEEQTEQCLILELDGGSILDCQLGIRRGDGSIILTIDFITNTNSCSFFVLRPTEWWQPVSLWLRTTFVIWRQMWGETRGRWEGLPVGKFLGTDFKIQILCSFPTMYRFRNLDFSAVSRDF